MFSLGTIMIMSAASSWSVHAADASVDDLFNRLLDGASFGFKSSDTPKLVSKTSDTITIAFPLVLDANQLPVKKYEILYDT